MRILKVVNTVCYSFSRNCIIHTSTWFSQLVVLKAWGLIINTTIYNYSSRLVLCTSVTYFKKKVPVLASKCSFNYKQYSLSHIITQNALVWQYHQLQMIIRLFIWEFHLCTYQLRNACCYIFITCSSKSCFQLTWNKYFRSQVQHLLHKFVT